MPYSTPLQVRCLILGLCLLLAAAAKPAWAGIAVSPLKQEISLKPGETGKLTLTLSYNNRNEFDPPQSMRLAVVDVQVTEAGDLAFKDVGTMPHSAGKWVALSDEEVTLDPAKSQVIECTITPPASAVPGEYYAAVLVTLASKGRTDKGLAIEYRIASGIFVTVLGRSPQKQAKLTRCELLWPQAPAAAATQPAATPPDAAAEEPSVPRVAVVLENTGEVRFDGSGQVRFIDERARTVFTAPLVSKRPCIFGGDSRLFEAPITKALPAGKYRLKVEMSYQSTWALARQEMPIEILPEAAELLAQFRARQPGGAIAVEVTPDKLAPIIPAGGTRSLALAVRNNTETLLRCKAGVAATTPLSASDAWISVGPEAFNISRSARKSIEVKVQVPAGTPVGKYNSMVTIEAGPDGSGARQLTVPIEFEVKAEK
jgi:hypothetical protein